MALSDHAKMEAQQFIYKEHLMYKHAMMVKAFMEKHGLEALKDVCESRGHNFKWYQDRLQLANLEPSIGAILDKASSWSPQAYVLAKLEYKDQLALLDKAASLDIHSFRLEVKTYLRGVRPRLVVTIRVASINKTTFEEMGQETQLIYDDDPRSKKTNEELEKEVEECEDELPFKDKLIGITRIPET